MRRPWALIAVFLTFTAGAVLNAEQAVPSSPPVGETLDVSLINLDVYVTDRAGNRVPGLTADDFVLIENGTEQPISNFTEYAANRTASSTVAPQGPRSVVIFIDDLYAHPINVRPVFASMKDFVRRTIRKGDSVTVIRWLEGRAETALEFTDDAEQASRVLDRIAREAQVPYSRVDEIQQEVAIGRSGARFDPRRPPIASPDRRSEGVLRVRALEEKARLERKIDAINRTINSLSTGDGKKALLLVTHRLSMFAGAEFFYASGRQQLPMAVAQELDMRQSIDTIVENANANGVTVYPIYPEGMTHSQGDASGTARPMTFDLDLLSNETPMLERVAQHTGGMTASGGRAIPELMPEIATDFSSYYSVAYRVAPMRVDRTREVLVKPKNPEHVVRARRTYVERSDETRMQDRVTAALFRNVADVSFVIAAEAGTRRGDTVPVTIRVPIAKLTPLRQDDGSHVAWITVWVAGGDREGDRSLPVSDRHSFRIAPGELDQANDGYLTYTVDVVVSRKADRIAVGVLDEVSKAFSLARVSLSGKGLQTASR